MLFFYLMEILSNENHKFYETKMLHKMHMFDIILLRYNMKNLNKITNIYNNKELKKMTIEQQEQWLRSKIVMQFIFLREKFGYTQQEIANKMGVMRQQITRFENMSNSPTIFFLVKYANALDTELDVILKGVNLIEVTNERTI